MTTTSNNSGGSAVGRLISGGDDQRIVLRRVRPFHQWPKLDDPVRPIRTVAVLDTETSGLDPNRDVVIEIAIAFAQVDAHGRILRVSSVAEAKQSPGFPLPAEISKLTGLTDEMLQGQSIDIDHITERLNSVQAIASHNAGFDRKFVERLLPDLPEKPWICSMMDGAWADWGFDGRKQDHLLMQAGLFNPVKHRAMSDVISLVSLLNTQVPTGRSVLAECIDHAKKPTWLFRAVGLPFEYRQRIKDRGWRWNAGGKVWWTEVPHADRAAEEQWYDQTFRPFRDKPVIERVTWTTRYKR